MTIEEFPAWVQAVEWTLLVTTLEDGSYKSNPVRRVEIEKPDGDARLLGLIVKERESSLIE